MPEARPLGTKAKAVIRSVAALNQANVFDALEVVSLLQAGKTVDAIDLLKTAAVRDVWAHQALVYLAADCLQEAEETLIDAKMRQDGRK